MSYTYADQATKTFQSATPTINAYGNVVRWEIEVQYVLNGYVSTLSRDFNVAPSKPPASYSKAELIAATNFDAIYDSQYQSVKMPPPAPAEVAVTDFDLGSLS